MMPERDPYQSIETSAVIWPAGDAHFADVPAGGYTVYDCMPANPAPQADSVL